MCNYQEIQGLLFGLLFELKAGVVKSLKGNRFDLTLMHHKLLSFICSFPGTTQQDIVEKTGRDKGQITRLVKELEKKELVTRQRDEADRRSFRIKATKDGEAAFKELKQYEDVIIRKALTGFTGGELEQFKRSLKKMRENLT